MWWVHFRIMLRVRSLHSNWIYIVLLWYRLLYSLPHLCRLLVLGVLFPGLVTLIASLDLGCCFTLLSKQEKQVYVQSAWKIPVPITGMVYFITNQLIVTLSWLLPASSAGKGDFWLVLSDVDACDSVLSGLGVSLLASGDEDRESGVRERGLSAGVWECDFSTGVRDLLALEAADCGGVWDFGGEGVADCGGVWEFGGGGVAGCGGVWEFGGGGVADCGGVWDLGGVGVGDCCSGVTDFSIGVLLLGVGVWCMEVGVVDLKPFGGWGEGFRPLEGLSLVGLGGGECCWLFASFSAFFFLDSCFDCLLVLLLLVSPSISSSWT